MDKVALKLNKPIQGALKFAKGRRGESTIPGKGDWVMYSLVSGEVLFIDTDDCENPDEMFFEANIGARDPFMLTLRKTSSGGRYLEVKKHGAVAEPVSRADADSLLFQAKLQESIALAEKQRKPAVTPQCAPAPVAVVPNSLSTPNPIALVPDARPRAGSLMASALVAAVDAVIIARDYAAAKGLSITFAAEDLRAIAATLYIQHCKEPQYSQRVGGRP